MHGDEGLAIPEVAALDVWRRCGREERGARGRGKLVSEGDSEREKGEKRDGGRVNGSLTLTPTFFVPRPSSFVLTGRFPPL